jgi:sigma-54 dependent transcriptional regulator, acetoin dehydrogenase operon transcriptional activator AcoR
VSAEIEKRRVHDPHGHRARLHPEISPEAENQIERRRVENAPRQSAGNRTEAAKVLGISRVSLWKKMKRYGIGGHNELLTD